MPTYEFSIAYRAIRMQAYHDGLVLIQPSNIAKIKTIPILVGMAKAAGAQCYLFLQATGLCPQGATPWNKPLGGESTTYCL